MRIGNKYNPSKAFIKINKFIFRGNIINNVKIKTISSGDDHIILLDFENNVYGIGNSSNGQLGDILKHKYYPDTVHTAEHIPKIKAISVHCSSNYTMLIDPRKNMWVMRYNKDQKLGIISKRDNILKPVMIHNLKVYAVETYKGSTYVIPI